MNTRPVRQGIRRLWEAETGTAAAAAALSLAPLGRLYGLASRLRAGLYGRGLLRVERLERPVVSVGNLEVGGTGKTPLVRFLARRLADMGLSPAVLSRGYRGRTGRPGVVVSDGRRVLAGPDRAGDEPVLLARTLPGVPVLAGPDRAALGREAVRSLGADVLLLDDGFQHLRLARQCDIVLLDRERPWGNGRCLPAGPLREEPAALGRCHVVLVPEGAAPEVRERVRRLAPAASLHALALVPAGLRGADGSGARARRVAAFAGIARPQRFFRDLEGAGVEVVAAVPFPDHHAFARAELEELVRLARRSGAEALVTTAKDAVRIPEAPQGIPLLILEREVRIEHEEALMREILGRIRGRASAAVRGGGG